MQNNDNKKTMRVYHFTTCDIAKLILKGKRLKLSDIRNLNDPFDFYVFKHRNESDQEAWNNTVNQLAPTFGTISFSANNSNPVQWAHYAESHKGICLGFDIIDSVLNRVRYFSNRIKLPLRTKEKDMRRAFLTKYKHWQYEEEYRALVLKKEQDINGNFYVNFDKDCQLKEVIFGYKSDLAKEEITLYCQGDENEIVIR